MGLVNVQDLLERIYRPAINLVGTCILAWLLSGLAVQFLSGLLPKARISGSAQASTQATKPLSAFRSYKRLDDYMIICQRNIFNPDDPSGCTKDMPEVARVEEVKKPTEDLNSPPIKSSINAKLLGTMVSTNPRYSFATIAKGSSRSGENYYLDDRLLGEAKIYKIERNRVFFLRNGRREYIEVDKLPAVYAQKSRKSTSRIKPKLGGIKKVGDKIIVSRARVDATLGDLNKVVQQARMVPDIKPDGSVNGFKVFAIRAGSIFQDLGLKNGDVIQQINGTKIDSVEKAIPMLQLARTSSAITIDIKRRGQKQTLKIEIEG